MGGQQKMIELLRSAKFAHKSLQNCAVFPWKRGRYFQWAFPTKNIYLPHWDHEMASIHQIASHPICIICRQHIMLLEVVSWTADTGTGCRKLSLVICYSRSPIMQYDYPTFFSHTGDFQYTRIWLGGHRARSGCQNFQFSMRS